MGICLFDVSEGFLNSLVQGFSVKPLVSSQWWWIHSCQWSLLFVLALSPRWVPVCAQIMARSGRTSLLKKPCLSITGDFPWTLMVLEQSLGFWCYDRILQVQWWLLTAQVPAGKDSSLEINQLYHTGKEKIKTHLELKPALTGAPHWLSCYCRYLHTMSIFMWGNIKR